MRQIEQNKRMELRIGTFNVQNVKSNSLYLQKLLKEVDILCIQEHWLYCNEKQQLSKIDPNFVCAAKSVDDNDSDLHRIIGRGYGGVAILWRKSIDEKLRIIPDGGSRIQALLLEQENQPICILNVYMPSDSKNANTEYKDTLSEIDEIMSKYGQTHNIIICGDMNGSLHRNKNAHDKILQEFCSEKEIYLQASFPEKPTFYHKSMPARSQIDYFLIKDHGPLSEGFRLIIEDMKAENTSDHVPVLLRFKCQLKRFKEKPKEIIVNPKWDSCDKQKYKARITNKIGDLMRVSKGNIETDVRNMEKLLHKAGQDAIPK